MCWASSTGSAAVALRAALDVRVLSMYPICTLYHIFIQYDDALDAAMRPRPVDGVGDGVRCVAQPSSKEPCGRAVADESNMKRRMARRRQP